ncbi:MAG: hypothetical protein LBF37_01350 [Rickettsiales bacterium]|nr:hypothetical protein [Rickettsiales bacterium]
MAIANAGLRELVLTPILGNISLPISGITLGILIFLLTYLCIPLLGKHKKQLYLKMGILWAFATIIFEFILGLLTGQSLSRMLNAYNILIGNLWLAVILFIIVTPVIGAKLRKVII